MYERPKYVHICIFHKRWSLILGWFFPVSVLKAWKTNWFTFNCHFCLTDWLLDISFNDLFLHIPWFLTLAKSGWRYWFGCVACCLFYMGHGVAEYIHWHSETVDPKRSAERKRRDLDELKTFFFVFGELCSALQTFHELPESLAAKSFWYSSIASDPVSYLSAILLNFLLFFS